MAEINNNLEIKAVSDLSGFGKVSKAQQSAVLENENTKVFAKADQSPKSSSQRLRDLSDCCGVDLDSF